ncbi:hypothetical protein ACM66B_000006 [Microbotryomycetes sp. NB124-2]
MAGSRESSSSDEGARPFAFNQHQEAAAASQQSPSPSSTPTYTFIDSECKQQMRDVKSRDAVANSETRQLAHVTPSNKLLASLAKLSVQDRDDLAQGVLVPLEQKLETFTTSVCRDLQLRLPERQALAIRLWIEATSPDIALRPLVTAMAWSTMISACNDKSSATSSLSPIAMRLELDIASHYPPASPLSPQSISTKLVTRKRHLPYVQTDSFDAPIQVSTPRSSSCLPPVPLRTTHWRSRTTMWSSDLNHSAASASASASIDSTNSLLDSPAASYSRHGKHRPLSLLIRNETAPSSPILSSRMEQPKSAPLEQSAAMVLRHVRAKVSSPTAQLMLNLETEVGIATDDWEPDHGSEASRLCSVLDASKAPFAYPHLQIYQPMYPYFDLYPSAAAASVQQPCMSELPTPPLVLIRKPTIKRPARASLLTSTRPTNLFVPVAPHFRESAVDEDDDQLRPRSNEPTATMDVTRKSELFGHLLPEFPNVPFHSDPSSTTTSLGPCSSPSSPSTAPSPTLNAAAINSFSLLQSRRVVRATSATDSDGVSVLDEYINKEWHDDDDDECRLSTHSAAELDEIERQLGSPSDEDRVTPFQSSHLVNSVYLYESEDTVATDTLYPSSSGMTTEVSASRSTDYLRFAQGRFFGYDELDERPEGLTSSFSDEEDDDETTHQRVLCFEDEEESDQTDQMREESEKFDESRQRLHERSSFFEDQSCQTFDHLSFERASSDNDELDSPWQYAQDV